MDVNRGIIPTIHIEFTGSDSASAQLLIEEEQRVEQQMLS
jgi:hypothetical protein